MDFRAINYLGSKLRILDFIEGYVNNISNPGDGICDLFAGTGCVSYRLSQNHPIVACDKQKYSEVICNALLTRRTISSKGINAFLEHIEGPFYKNLLNEYSSLIAIEENAISSHDVDTLSSIIEHGSIEISRLNGCPCDTTLSQAIFGVNKGIIDPLDCVMTEFYGGVYFSYRQAIQIDSILHEIKQSSQSDPILLAALLSTVSEIVNTVGKHFAQPLKTRDSSGKIKPLLYKTAQKDRGINVFKVYKEWVNRYYNNSIGPYYNEVKNIDILDCLRSLPDSVSVVYADPPYTREHYSRYYHVLETIVLGDRPEISKTKIGGTEQYSRGIYRVERYQSPFCIRSKAPEVFNEMMQIISEQNKKLLLAYSPYDTTKNSHPRVVTMDQLMNIAQSNFKNVELVSAGHFTHNKFNSKDHHLEASDAAEVMIVCNN